MIHKSAPDVQVNGVVFLVIPETRHSGVECYIISEHYLHEIQERDLFHSY